MDFLRSRQLRSTTLTKKSNVAKGSGTHTFTDTKVGCVLLEEGKAKPFKPGQKPDLVPIWDKDMCTRCGICFIFCPDAAIKRGEDGYYEVILDYCKGCGICHQECWFGAISMTEEE